MKRDRKRMHLPPLANDAGLDEEIVRRRAYELYVDRGMENGRDLEDWFRAEQELAARKSQSVPA